MRKESLVAACAALALPCAAASAGTLTGDCDGWQVTGESHFSFPFTITVTASLTDSNSLIVVTSSSDSTSLPAGGGPWAVSNTWPGVIPAGDYFIAALEVVINDNNGNTALTLDLVFPVDGTALHCKGNGEGCTPGYWRQEQHFDDWPAPYTPGTLFSDVFDDAFPGETLLDVLGQGGGALDALGRHTVAALLNGASGNVNYPFTDLEVTDLFNDVFAGSNDDYEALKDTFEAANEAGCPLNGFSDLSGDGDVNMADMLIVLDAWGTKSVDADITRDGVIGIADLMRILTWWGS